MTFITPSALITAAGFSRVLVYNRSEMKTKKIFLSTIATTYLIAASATETVDLSKVVFNTEAHPIRGTW